ncbi:MAG: SGNH/GDSL hydrolase family protein [Lapillicoccus sp.]
MAAFTYSNVSDRPPGRFLRVAGALLPGVRSVQGMVAPYAAAWERDNAVALAASGPLWVAIGDSMTQGIGASAHDRGYVGQLSARLTARGWAHRLVNLSVTGARVQDVLDRQLPALEALTATEGEPALVTVIIGSNDIFLRRHREHLLTGFTEMLDRLPAGAVVSNLPNPRGEARLVDALLRRRQDDGTLVVADMMRDGPRSWRGRLAPDTFHPNDRGYADMAAAFERALDRSGLPRSPDPQEGHQG